MHRAAGIARPDAVVVYGTLIIGKRVIAASERIINLHTGFSPTYRALTRFSGRSHNRDPDNIGVTVHRLDAGVDLGPILARGKPPIAPGDDEDRIFANAVKLGAELLGRAVRRDVEGLARPIPEQLELGKEYRSVDRTLAAERRTRKVLKIGLVSEARAAWSEEF